MKFNIVGLNISRKKARKWDFYIWPGLQDRLIVLGKWWIEW